MERRLLERRMGGKSASRRPWLDRGDADSVFAAPVSAKRPVHVGYQLPEGRRAPQRALLCGLHAEERQRLCLPVSRSRRDREYQRRAAGGFSPLPYDASRILEPPPERSVQQRFPV